MDNIRPGSGAPPPRFTIRYVPAILYRCDGVTVTSLFFETCGRRYPVRELTEMWRVLPPPEPARFHALLTSMVLVTAVVAPAALRNPDTPPAWAALLVGALAGVVLTLRLLRIRRRPRVAELWGSFRGCPVRLFATTDATQFGQVYRALVRAREFARPTR